MRANKRVLMGKPHRGFIVYVASVMSHYAVSNNKPHRGFVVYRAGLPSAVRLPCLWNARESNAKGVALSLLTYVFMCQIPHANIQIGRQRNTDGVAFTSLVPWQRWHCMPTLPYKKRNRDAVCGLRGICIPTITYRFGLNWKRKHATAWSGRTGRASLHASYQQSILSFC